MLRVLPLTLIAVLLVLPLKLGVLVDGFPVIAQQFDREFGKHERPWADDLKARSVPEPPATASGVAPGTAPPTLACGDSALRSALAEQKADVAARTRHLGEAEAVLGATETRIATQLQRLAEIKREIEGLMKQRSTLQQEDIRRMVAVYEAMKPRDAARILSDLDTDVVIDVLDHMAERRSAPILAELADAKAREVTRTILQRRALPGDRVLPAAAPAAPAAARPAPRPVLNN
ncbi:flagellar motor switch protein [Azospirillum sp. TSO22-1]|uniref:MotE family protein n=1 Tax=Azospirillum sp. TSO22-1 TaxID=716789 RepID=UPI000D6212B6|nr:flagellar motor switch protein [Azospirillum sp. TSO22-1]PWC35150.1 flagellar motor switch protein [Azospirillum sp. TSO22-1]